MMSFGFYHNDGNRFYWRLSYLFYRKIQYINEERFTIPLQ